MSEYGHLTRDQLISRIRELETVPDADRGPGSGKPVDFPVFIAWHQREFDRSPWPMRIFEHGSFRYLAVNDAAVKFYGYSRHEFLALTAMDTRHVEEHAMFHSSMKESTSYLRHRAPRHHVKKSGEVVVVEVVTQDILFDGRLARLAMTIDVTKRIRAENELRESNEFLRSVIESSRDCIKVLDLEGRLLSMNAGGQRLLEIEELAPLLNASWLELWHGEDRAAASAAAATALNGGMGSFEGYCPTRKGTPKWWDVAVSPILDADGKPAKLLAVSRDITRRRQLHSDLRKSREWLELAVENSGLVLWDWNLATDEVVRHISGEDKVECLPSERPGHLDTWRSRIHPQDWPRVEAALNEHFRGSTSYYVSEHRLRTDSGDWMWVLHRGRVVDRDAAGKPLRMIGGRGDITAQKSAEEERITQLRQQRDALVREVHHRIKNSLQGVAGLLRQKTRKYPAIAPGIEEAIAQLQSVALVYGLQETRPDGLIALAEIMDEVCASAEGLTGGHVDRALERKTTRPACVAGSEAVSVAVALNELVFNALKHQAGTGKKRARVTLLESKDAAEIRIANRGRLPKGFDYPGGRLVGHGLGLVHTLLASPGGNVAFNGGRNEVEVVLILRPPLLSGQQKATAR